MIYFLDTNTCIFHLNAKFDSIKLKLDKLPRTAIQIPSVVAAELYYGACKSERKEYNLKRYLTFLSAYEVVPFSHNASRIYGDIRADLEHKGRIISANDLLIAATVIANDGILVTNNTDEFSRVSQLVIEDWTKL